MLLKITHETRYGYDTPVPYGLMQLRLIPEEDAAQHMLEWNIAIEGGAEELRYADHFGNVVVLAGIAPGEHEVLLTVSGSVETRDTAGVAGPHAGPAPLWLYSRPTARTRAGNGVRALARGLAAASAPPLELLHALMARVADALPYQTGQTNAHTTAEEALAHGCGVCQDHAHVFMAAARLLGFPTRYVSGYLMTEGRAQHEASHAWAEAHVEGLGWVGFDVSNRICPDARYVRLASGLDYADAAPVRGVHFSPADETLAVSLRVEQQQ